LAEYGEQLGHIRQYLDANRSTERMAVQKDKETERKAEMGKEELRQRLEAALESLENFQAKDCARKLEEILEYPLEGDRKEELGEIREQLKLYEDDAAEQMLRDIIGRIG